MRVALISDLHGNDLALGQVLADIDDFGVDRVICLGDTATLGARPREILERLEDRRIPTIQGNHDDFLLRPELVESYSEAPVISEAVAWCRTELAERHFEFVRTFVSHLDVELGLDRILRLYHGSPRSHMEDLLVSTPAEVLDEFVAHPAVAFAGGHTHVAMLRQHKGKLFVNPGSVGMPFLEYVHGRAPTLLAHAEWACVESRPNGISVQLQRIELDRKALRAQATSTAHPLATFLSQQYA